MANTGYVVRHSSNCRLRCYHGEVNGPAGTSWRALRTVFLDRDGVLNKKMPEGRYVAAWEDFHVLPGVPEALARLNRAGLRVIVVSNQRGIALGLYTAADVAAIHAAFQHLLSGHDARVDAFYICPHDKGQCNCRKPLPGLFEQAQADFPGLSAGASVMIGDTPADIEFGRSLGMATICIAGDPALHKPGAAAGCEAADFRFSSLNEAVGALLTMLAPD